MRYDLSEQIKNSDGLVVQRQRGDRTLEPMTMALAIIDALSSQSNLGADEMMSRFALMKKIAAAPENTDLTENEVVVIVAAVAANWQVMVAAPVIDKLRNDPLPGKA